MPAMSTACRVVKLSQLGAPCAHRSPDRKHTIGCDDFMSKIFNE